MKKVLFGFFCLVLLFGLTAYSLESRAGAGDPEVEITRAFVTNLRGNMAYKGDIVDFVICFDVTGGGSDQEYLAKVVVLPNYGDNCGKKKKKIVYETEPGVVVGPDSYVVTIPNKVPRCADDMTYGTSFTGSPYVMEGNWVDMVYRVKLLDLNGKKLAKDVWKEVQVFKVKKRP